MKTTTTIFIGILVLIFNSCSPSASNKLASSPDEFKLQSIIDSIYQQHPDAVGIMVHVESPNRKISWSGAAGVIEKGSSTPINVNQPAWIASNTKTYVATAILRLVEQGKVQLNDPINKLLTSKTNQLLVDDGYNTSAITLAHLLSHTSGIFDYVNAEEFFNRIKTNPKYRWTRDEQIKLAITDGQPLGKTGSSFSYADTNFHLASEIIEGLTGKPFYTSIRDLINYKKQGLASTWFISLEDKPTHVLPFVHQSFGAMELDTRKVDPSFDLYGGGGLAASTKDLALFSQRLFEGQIFDNKETKDLILTTIKTSDQKDNNYYLGLSGSTINGLQAYGHGGFWATVVQYIPELNASISVFILERDKRILRKDVLEAMVGYLQK